MAAFPLCAISASTIGEGRIVGLLGANGAGKTTLMRAMSGLATMQGGRIEFAGSDVTGLSSAELVARGLIQVPQGRHLFGEMSVRENLEMGAYLVPGQAAQARMQEVFSLFPILRERETATGRASLRRRAADAGCRARADVGAALPVDGRAVARSRAQGVRPHPRCRQTDQWQRHDRLHRRAERAQGAARRPLLLRAGERPHRHRRRKPACFLADDRIQRSYLGVAHS